jgi:hypothetical protein
VAGGGGYCLGGHTSVKLPSAVPVALNRQKTRGVTAEGSRPRHAPAVNDRDGDFAIVENPMEQAPSQYANHSVATVAPKCSQVLPD